MNRASAAKTSQTPSRPVVPPLLFGLAAVLAGYMAVGALRGGGLAGCDPASGCGQVLASKWAYFFGIPVSLGGALIYLGLVAATWLGFGPRGSAPARLAGVLLSGVAITAALWFFALQLWVVKAFCAFCGATHLLACVGAVLLLARANRAGSGAWRPALAGLAAIPLLLVGQSVSQPKTFAEVRYQQPTNQPAATTSPNPTPTTPPAAPLPAATNPSPTPPQPRLLPVLGGAMQLDLNQVPIWGNSNATHFVVSLFDYTCHHCRDMHFMLGNLLARHPETLAVVSLPMPLDAACNPMVRQTPPSHIGACDYARLGLAVWLGAPDKLHDFDEYIFAPERPPAIADATKRAGQLVGEEALAKLVNNPWVEQQIQTDVALYRANSQRAQRGSMPQLIFPGGTVIGGVASEAELAKIFNQHFQLDPVAAPPAPTGQTAPTPPPR